MLCAQEKGTEGIKIDPSVHFNSSTVQKWEQGQKKPNGPSLKLLNLVAERGLEALD